MPAGRNKKSAKWKQKNNARAALHRVKLHSAQKKDVAETGKAPWDAVTTTSYLANSVGQDIIEKHGTPKNNTEHEHLITEQCLVFASALRQRLAFSMDAAASAAEPPTAVPPTDDSHEQRLAPADDSEMDAAVSAAEPPTEAPADNSGARSKKCQGNEFGVHVKSGLPSVGPPPSTCASLSVDPSSKSPATLPATPN